jgi:large subunit ribosomal protein L15
MQIHELKTKYGNKRKKRVGRGGKRGTTSGKGQKGQRARAGHSIPSVEIAQIRKFPKLRGTNNKSNQSRVVILDLNQMNKLAEGGKLDRKILIQKGIIKKISVRVKILDRGDVKMPVAVEGIPTSSGAKAKIEKAGGSVK